MCSDYVKAFGASSKQFMRKISMNSIYYPRAEKEPYFAEIGKLRRLCNRSDRHCMKQAASEALDSL